MTNSQREEKNTIENFISGGGIAGIVIGIIMLILLVLGSVYFLKHKQSASAIKYLTSSTSPGFDLTFTPNM
jgi:hypothetical protein